LDHVAAGFSAKEHPLAHVRSALAERGYIESAALRQQRDGDVVSVAGLVITRQRPKTAKGTFFITLEDEGGFANIIVPKKCYEQQRRLLRRVRFLGCRGRLQLRDGVVNLLANSFEDLEPAELLASPTRGQHLPVWGSRDFR
jgi:DNA polymerase III alpha subunit